MNRLAIGLDDKSDALLCKPGLLLTDDDQLCDAFLGRYPKAAIFDTDKHSFNPLKKIDEKGALQFVDIIYDGAGKDTLTVRNGKRFLADTITK